MKNKEYYQSVFDEVHVPQEVLGKVMDMGMEEKKLRKKKVWKNAMTTVAALAICFVASNGICYAATGSTWTEKVLLYINGEPTQQEITWQQDGDVTYAEMEVEVDEAGEVVVYHEETVPGDEETSYEYMTLVTEVVEEDGKIYLVINGEKTDITEDFADGSCSGTVEMDGVVITYQVDGNANEYSIVIQ